MGARLGLPRILREVTHPMTCECNRIAIDWKAHRTCWCDMKYPARCLDCGWEGHIVYGSEAGEHMINPDKPGTATRTTPPLSLYRKKLLENMPI